MSVDWAPLRTELAHWRQAGIDLPIWWRDDDATEVTPALQELARLATELGLPVHLAVVPRDAEPSLTEVCTAHSALIPMVHGWAHENHAPFGQKKAEFNHFRPGQQREISDGLVRLEALFGPQLLKIFVPPWNRISDDIIIILQQVGYLGLSTFTPRSARYAAPGLIQINTHIDPINWRGGGGLRDTKAIVGELVTLLKERRSGATDREEPLGILTHHLVHDDAIWEFTKACITELLSGGARGCNLRDMGGNLP